MSGLCGWIGWTGSDPDSRAALTSMAAPVTEYDGSRATMWLGDREALAGAHPGGDATISHEEGLVACVAGRPHWDLSDLQADSREEGAATAFLRGYRRLGRGVLEGMHGAFAAVLLDPREQRAFLAIDRHGIWPLFYEQREGLLLFGSTGASLDAHPAGASELSPQGLFDYVYFGFVPGPVSVRHGRMRLLPGECLEFEKGRLKRETYYSVRYRDHDSVSPKHLKEELHRLLQESVRRSAEGAEVGAFLSGGIDSSTVAGLLGEVSDRPARTYSIGFDVERFDEMRYARIAAKHFGTDHHERYVTPADVLALVPRLARVYSEPFGNESAIPAFCCAEFARDDGIERILGGDGGDEIFCGNPWYSLQKFLGLYDRLPRLARRVLEPALFRFPFGDHLWPVRKARGYVRQARTEMPARLETYNHVVRLGAETIFEPDFLAKVDPGHPLALLTQVYDGAEAGTMLNRILAVDRKFTLADSDLPKVSRMCELAAIQVEYPMLSDALVDFAARVPVHLKLKGFKLRHFFKWAMRDFLPAETIRKRKHGFGLPFGIWLTSYEPLRELALESLKNLRGRGFFRQAFMDELLRAHRADHATYYGVMIWHLMMLEQWCQAHVDDSLRTPARGI